MAPDFRRMAENFKKEHEEKEAERHAKALEVEQKAMDERSQSVEMLKAHVCQFLYGVKQNISEAIPDVQIDINEEFSLRNTNPYVSFVMHGPEMNFLNRSKVEPSSMMAYFSYKGSNFYLSYRANSPESDKEKFHYSDIDNVIGGCVEKMLASYYKKVRSIQSGFDE